jgi:hypothetical protein
MSAIRASAVRDYRQRTAMLWGGFVAALAFMAGAAYVYPLLHIWKPNSLHLEVWAMIVVFGIILWTGATPYFRFVCPRCGQLFNLPMTAHGFACVHCGLSLRAMRDAAKKQ